MKDRPIVPAIVGPTCSGKSGVALQVAGALGAEIVSMDSMQVYRGFDIGTAKVSEEERRKVRHHLIDICEATEPFTAADYANRAKTVIREILSRGKTPVLAGGTGLYLDAVRYRMSMGSKPGDSEIRQKLKAIAGTEDGRTVLYRMLEERDPQAAARLHPNDVRRVIRALETADEDAQPLPKAERLEEEDFRVAPYGLTMDRGELYKRIDKRVDEMIKLGLFSEWDRLNEQYPFDTWAGAAQAIGYKEIKGLKDGFYTREEAVRLIKRNSRRYAKRQMTWFLREPGIRWFNREDYDSEEALCSAVLEAVVRDMEGPEHGTEKRER